MAPQRASGSEVAIVGGGLVGSLLAVFLARRGLDVALYEGRPDPRTGPDAGGGRSINLVITSRGTGALRSVGLEQGAASLTVPVLGRMIHAVDGALSYQPYGKDTTERNLSISRAGLNAFLLDAAERHAVRLHFGRRLVAANPDRGRLRFVAEDCGSALEVEAAVVFGADGAGSALRAQLVAVGACSESVEMLAQGYKELVIPAGADGGFRIEPRALHIWPRGALMLMALPNLDGSFTVTLYLPHRGSGGFESLVDEADVRELFRVQFADALDLIPDLARDFFSHPTGELGTVRCAPWHRGGRALLVGDAAHAIVPFFGQGMNCGFEDCTVLDGLVERHGDDWETVFEAFHRERKPDADAIADMALDNFVEMRDRVGDPAFLLRKQVEHRLENEMPREYRSRYSMICYSSIPYAVAREAGAVQEGILAELCAGLDSAEALDLARARSIVRERLAPLLARRGVSLDY